MKYANLPSQTSQCFKFNCGSPAYHYNPTVYKGIQLQWVFHWNFHVTTFTWDYSSQNISILREPQNHMVDLSTDTWVNWDPERGTHYMPQRILGWQPTEEKTHMNGLKRLREEPLHTSFPPLTSLIPSSEKPSQTLSCWVEYPAQSYHSAL